MPITITPSQPGARVGPGLQTGFQTSFIGPIETGSSWVLGLTTDSEGSLGIIQYTIAATTAVTSLLWYSSTPTSFPFIGQLQPRAGDTVFVQAKLVAPNQTTVLDSGTLSTTWSSTDGLGLQLLEKTTTGGGGLTSEQAVQLSETHGSTFPTELLDNITLQPLTSGPSTGPVNSGLLRFTFGVIVRISNVPPELVPDTPDGDYWFPSLAVVRVFRGADLWLRVPVHTSSKIVSFVEQSVVAGLAQVTGTLWLLNMTVQVTFRTGVTGEVFLMVFP